MIYTILQSANPGTPSALGVAIGVVVTFAGGALLYILRQYTERLKLRKALRAEVQQMSGIKKCSDSMDRISFSAEKRDLGADEVPPSGSIPTVVYESNAGRLGLLRSEELECVVSFYSKVMHYKAIISAVRGGEDVPDPDQKDLYNKISEVESQRDRILGNKGLFGGIFNDEV